MNTSVATDDIDMADFPPCEPVVVARKRVPKEYISKAHISCQQICPRRETHPAVRAKNKHEKKSRRINITPLPGSSLARGPFDPRFARGKSTWCSLAFGVLEQEEEDRWFFEQQERPKLGDWEMGNTPVSPPFAQYEEGMDCAYDTMDPRAVFQMSGGIFGCPSPGFGTSTSSTNTFGSSTGCGGTASTFSVSTAASSKGSQPSAVTFSGPQSSATAGSISTSSSDVTMTDAVDVSTDDVAAAPSVPIAVVPAAPPSQPSKPMNTAPVAPPPFTGLGFLPSKPLKSETVTSSRPVAVSGAQVSGKSACAPQIPKPVAASQSAPTPQPEDAAKVPLKSQSPAPAKDIKLIVSSPPVEDTKPAVTPPSVEKTKHTKSSPPIDNTKTAEMSPPVVDANAPTGTSRRTIKPRMRSKVSQLEPKEAPLEQVELGMGAFDPAKIKDTKALISAFSNPHFKQFFAEETETLNSRLQAKKRIRGTHVVFLWRSLKWISDSHEGKWFDGDIEFEDDVADWRGKLNILMATLEKDVGTDEMGIAADTRVKLEKVFVILGGADDLN